MKKLTALIMALLMMMTVVGCGGDDSSDTGSKKPETTASKESGKAGVINNLGAESELKKGIIYDIDSVSKEFWQSSKEDEATNFQIVLDKIRDLHGTDTGKMLPLDVKEHTLYRSVFADSNFTGDYYKIDVNKGGMLIPISIRNDNLYDLSTVSEYAFLDSELNVGFISLYFTENSDNFTGEVKETKSSHGFVWGKKDDGDIVILKKMKAKNIFTIYIETSSKTKLSDADYDTLIENIAKNFVITENKVNENKSVVVSTYKNIKDNTLNAVTNTNYNFKNTKISSFDYVGHIIIEHDKFGYIVIQCLDEELQYCLNTNSRKESDRNGFEIYRHAENDKLSDLVLTKNGYIYKIDIDYIRGTDNVYTIQENEKEFTDYLFTEIFK